MDGLLFLLGAYIIADAILFVNGYKSGFFHAKTELEKKVRAKFFADNGIDWDYETENPPSRIKRIFKGKN